MITDAIFVSIYKLRGYIVNQPLYIIVIEKVFPRFNA